MGLRAVAFVAGNKIIRFLKKKIILVDKHTDIAFRRKITFQDGVLQIEDEIESPKPVCLEGRTALLSGMWPQESFSLFLIFVFMIVKVMETVRNFT